MKERKVELMMPLLDSDAEAKYHVIGVYPMAQCIKLIYQDGTMHFQVSSSDEANSWIGYSTKSQTKAWENAWNVITKKMMKRLHS